eukprot:m.219715 g.219715  ORF g.219715 m.219715 type:complete len:224 (-) comp17003_c7_seq5:552-1223(-)
MVLQLTYEGFESLIKKDPVPHVVVDCRSDTQATIPFVEDAKTKVVGLSEYNDSLVAEDGCAAIVYDGSEVPTFTSQRAVVLFNMNTKPASEPTKLNSKTCQDLMTEGDANLALDVRRDDEVANFGKLPQAVHIPLHVMLGQLSDGSPSEAMQEILTTTKSVVVNCRTSRRAQFCAQVLVDQGVKAVFYLDTGACGLSKFPENNMKCYKSYELTDPVPEPSEEP